jgi:hypothetical protein
MAAARYTVNIGVFNRTWSKLYAFGSHLDALTVSTTNPGRATLAVETAGAGSGRVTSDPAGIECGIVCSAVYSRGGALVTLTAVAGASRRARSDWSPTPVVTATFEPLPPPPIGSLRLTLEPNQALFRPGDMLRLASR